LDQRRQRVTCAVRVTVEATTIADSFTLFYSVLRGKETAYKNKPYISPTY